MARTAKLSHDARRSPGKPVATKKVAISVVGATSSTAWDEDVEINGKLVAFAYDIPALDGTPTVTFKFQDEDGNTWHTKTSIAEDNHTLEKLQIDSAPRQFSYVGTATFAVTTDANQGTAETINVIAYIE